MTEASPDSSWERMKKNMNCQQFQEVLPYIIESGGNAEEEQHLRTCAPCSELVQDLQYIAQQAKLLLPMHDPSPRVWSGIEQSLHRQGLAQEGRMSPRGQIANLSTQIKSGTILGWFLAFAAVALFATRLITYRPSPPLSDSGQNISAPPASMAVEDQQLLARVSEQAPEERGAYETSLHEVNAYIVDAQQAVDDDPQDAAALAHLREAYQQKEMLYQMATARALP
jgi:HAMP domain-containing protein